MDFYRKLYSKRYSPPALGEEGRFHSFHFILQGENEDPVPVHAIFFRERTDLDMEEYGRGVVVPHGIGKGVVEEFVKFLYLEQLDEDVGMKEECNLLRLSILTQLKHEYQRKLVNLIDAIKNKKEVTEVRKDPEEDQGRRPSPSHSHENVDDCDHHSEREDDLVGDQEHEQRRPRERQRMTMPRKNARQRNVGRITTRSMSAPRGHQPVVVVIPLLSPIAPSTTSTLPRCPERGSTCYFCCKRFRKLEFLEVHLTDHTNENPHHPKKQPARNRNRIKCSKCQKTFSGKGSLAHHLHHIHRQFAIHACPHCLIKFKFRRYLKHHLDACHKGERYKCRKCQKSYMYKQSLQVHVDTIHNKIVQRCPRAHCNAVYIHRKNLRAHLKAKHDKK